MTVCTFERMWVFGFLVRSCVWPQGDWNDCECVCVSFNTALIRLVLKILKALTVLWNMTTAISTFWQICICGSDPWQNPPLHLDRLIQQAFQMKMMRTSEEDGHIVKCSSVCSQCLPHSSIALPYKDMTFKFWMKVNYLLMSTLQKNSFNSFNKLHC